MNNPTVTWQKNVMQDCVFVEPFTELNNAKVDVLFTVKFGEHLCPYELFGSEIRFVVTRGELRLDISNGKIESGDLEFETEFAGYTEVTIQRETSETETTKATEKATLGAKADPDPSLGLNVGVQKDHTKLEGSKERVTFKEKAFHILANWSSVQPRWAFYNNLIEKYLRGNLDKSRYVSVTANGHPLTIRYEFVVKPKHIHFSELPLTEAPDHINKTIMTRQALIVLLTGAPKIFSSGEMVA